MSIRPVATRWFEVLVLKRDRDAALDCLAQTGAVQLEARDDSFEPPPGLLQSVSEYDSLAARYRVWWPEPHFSTAKGVGHPARRMEQALTYLRSWAVDADETIERLQANLRRRDDLEILRSLLARTDADTPDLARFLGAGPRFRSLIFRLLPDVVVPDMPADILSLRLADESGDFLLAMGAAGAMASVESALAAQKCRVVNMSGWTPGKPGTALDEIDHQLEDLREVCGRDEAVLKAIGEKHGLGEALGEIVQSKWLSEIVPEVNHTRRMARITGWTNDRDGGRVERAMAASGIHYLAAFPQAPPGRNPPVILHNPPWSRPFEALTRLLGMPASQEADPSVLVSIVAPVLFGVMFGDLGQGLVLLIAGLVLRARNPAFGVLISGGAMAMLFGLLFGSVFSREDIIPALWLRPLQHPITLLAASVAAGAVILFTGLVLDAMQMHWQGMAAGWWRSRAGLPVAYCGLLVAVFSFPAGLTLAAAGVVWFVAGAALRDGWNNGLRAFGKMIELLVQLAVNTVSFARTGAFALAHAGLSVAVIELAETAGTIGYWPLLVVGNAFIIVLEGLVVSIQTTRLILFEFFVRFLRTGGREFRPLKPPRGKVTSLTWGAP